MEPQFGSRSRIVVSTQPDTEAATPAQAPVQEAPPQATPAQAPVGVGMDGIERVVRGLLTEFLAGNQQSPLATPSVMSEDLDPAVSPDPDRQFSQSGVPEDQRIFEPEAEVVPTEEGVATSVRPNLREDDGLISKALSLNTTNTNLSKASIVDQVKSLVGNNDYAAGILGAFTKEAGSNFSSLEENTNYSLSNAKSVFSAKRIEDALKAVTPEIREKINSGGRDKAFGEALMSHYGGGGKYHGRGLIHITHDYNYKAVGDKIGVDLVANPDLVKDPRYAVPAALAFLEMNDYFNPDEPITKDRLHNIVNRWSGQKIKDDRWEAAESFREDTPSVEASKRPKMPEKKDN